MFIFLSKNICKNALDALDECHHDVFLILHGVLCIICSLPISVASAERTFSTFRMYKYEKNNILCTIKLIILTYSLA